MSYLETLTDWGLDRELTDRTRQIEKEKTIKRILKEEGLFLGWNRQNSEDRMIWLLEQEGAIRSEIARRRQNTNCFT